MSWGDVLHVLTAAGIRAGDLNMSTPEATALAEALERARVVAVLDGWADADASNREWRSSRSADGRGVCHLYNYARKSGYHYGPTPDAARAAAARAIEKGEV